MITWKLSAKAKNGFDLFLENQKLGRDKDKIGHKNIEWSEYCLLYEISGFVDRRSTNIIALYVPCKIVSTQSVNKYENNNNIGSTTNLGV